jgi:hypothetical protein
VNGWVDVQNALMQYYTHAFSSRESYANQLLFWDNQFPKVTINDTIARFDRNAQCAMTAIGLFFTQIIQHDPIVVMNQLIKIVDGWFQTGVC